MGSGGRGVEYTITSSEPTLETVLEWRDVGWIGAGWGEVCVEEWGEVVGEELSFEVEGRSVLFGTTAKSNYSFVVFSSSSSSSSNRQILDCNPSLWDTSLENLYGIQTYPSGVQLLPSSFRSSPFTITTKALSPCTSIGMSKDILLPFKFNWTILDPIPDGLIDVNLNEWSMGSQLVIPREYLDDRTAFPLNQPVAIEV